MAMSREEQDAFDRRMAGIMDPRDPMTDTQRGMAGGPIASYGMSDLRRLLGLGAPGSPAPSVDAAEMYQQLTPRAPIPVPPGGYDAPSPSIPYMPSTDPRGASAPIPPPPAPPAPRAAAPARPAAASLPVLQGVPSEADMQWNPSMRPPRPDRFGGVSPYDMAVARWVQTPIGPRTGVNEAGDIVNNPNAPPVIAQSGMTPEDAQSLVQAREQMGGPRLPPLSPVALANPQRPTPQRLAEILRGRQMPSFPAPSSPGWEGQLSGAPMAAEPVMRMRR